MELKLYGGCLKKIQKRYLNVSKKIKMKILDVDNFEIYNSAKSRFKIRCILG
jgi:hypothetical protein